MLAARGEEGGMSALSWGRGAARVGRALRRSSSRPRTAAGEGNAGEVWRPAAGARFCCAAVTFGFPRPAGRLPPTFALCPAGSRGSPGLDRVPRLGTASRVEAAGTLTFDPG